MNLQTARVNTCLLTVATTWPLRTISYDGPHVRSLWHRTKAEPGRGALGSASIDPGQHQFATNMTLASARTTLDDKVPAWLSPSSHDVETSLSRKRPDLGYRALLTSQQHHLDR